jgi:tetratricopeptide (TPR) repeat protein
MATLSQALAIALQHHQAGRLQAAEQIYRQILALQPNQPDALHLLGLIAHQAGKHELAVEYIRRAIGASGTVATFHNTLANALQAQGKLDEAVACYHRALQLKPDYVEAHNNLGTALKDQGKLDEAVACYRRALQLKPDSAEVHSNLGIAWKDLGKPDEAVACYRRAIELKPDFAEVHNNLGAAFKDQGKLAEAIACYRRALQLKPDYADAHNNLGDALQGQGKFDEAVACYRRALEWKPDFAVAHSNLGAALQAQGKLDEAVACYRRALQLKPDFAEAHNNLGNILQDQGRLDEAVACYRRALELKADFAEAHANLGAALKDQGKLDEAVACYQRALELKPGYAEARYNFGTACKEQGKLEEAIACYRRALELKPDFAEAHNNLGNILRDQGKLEEAAACYRRALELKPDFAEAHNNLGNLCKDQGKLEEAVACYRRALQLELALRAAPTRPRKAEAYGSLGNAFCQLATILRSRLPEDDLRVGRQLLSEPNLRDDGRAAVELGLAQVLDARGDYRQAARHIREGGAARLAALQKRKEDYHPGDYRACVDGLIAAFTPEFVARTSAFGLETELPVFIFGLPRSGTTLVEQILASHSLVFGAGELRWVEETFLLLPQAAGRNDAPLQCLPELDGGTSRYLARQHADRLQALDPRAVRIADKMPGNYQHLGFIRLLFPQARLIHCRRDLRDVALSCRMTNFTSLSWACDPDHILSHFEDYSRLMDHWRRVLPAAILDIDYEEMVEDTEGVARRMVQWCGLSWEPGCLRFHETPRPVRTASAVQVRRPIYKSSIGRWKNYEESLGEWFSRVHQLDEPRRR